jgi:hypothetical protein
MTRSAECAKSSRGISGEADRDRTDGFFVNVELVRSIGVDPVIASIREEVIPRPERYDLIPDAAASRSAWDHRRT